MIKLAKNIGTCNGSTSALNLVYDIYEKEIIKENPKRICIYKELLHNEKVMEEFNNLGIETIYDLEELTSDDIVIIRTHGEAKSTFDYLESNNIEYYDATCPKVIKIHEKVISKYNAGYEIIIIGNSEHPEVIGTNGWCNNEAIIISSEEDLNKINDNGKKKFITCQTTISKEKFTELSEMIKNNYPDSEFYDATCSVVKKVVDEAVELAESCDVMFVIGGASSSNTKLIFDSLISIRETYMFSNILEFMKFIMESNIQENMTIGITGGVSAPIKEIYNYKNLLEFLLFYKNELKKLKNNQDRINNSLYNNDDHKFVKKIVEDITDLNKDGKYIRGILIALGYYLATLPDNKNDDTYLNLAYAYELFQTSILIHDDIIDNAKFRRSKETIPRRICHMYIDKHSNNKYHNDTIRLANSVAICAGDLGFYEANKIIINNYRENPNFAKVMEIYNDIVIKTIKGEIIDVYLPFVGKYKYDKVSENDILDIYHLKTSWYTIIGPFTLGHALGGKEVSSNLVSILNKIGISFQLKDDILGIFADSQVIGKPNTADSEEFKQTLLYSYVINTSFKSDFLKIYGNSNIGEKDLNNIRDILYKSGSYDYAIDYLNNLEAECNEEIDKLDVPEEFKNIIKGLLIYINIREK